MTDKLPGNCDEKQDRFARYVVKYGKKTTAYRMVYGDETAIRKESIYEMASRRAANPEVAARIEYYARIARKLWAVDIDKIGEQLSKMMLVDKRDVYDDKGCILPPHQWPEHVAKTISGIEVEESKDAEGNVTGVTKKVTFEPRASAAKILAIWKGMQVQRVEVGQPGEFDHLSDEQLDKEMKARESMLEAVERARKPVRKIVTKKRPQEES